MKIFKPFLAIAVMLIAFASCKDSSDTLTNAIPADAIGVYHVDVQSLASKSNYDLFKNETVLRGINLAKGMIGKQEAVDLIDAFTKDINAAGLNLKGNCYAYMNGTTVGVVLGVNNAEKFKNTLINFSLPAEMIQQENGINIMDLDGSAVVAWSAEKLLLLANMNRYNAAGEETVDLKATVLKQMAQGADESINSNPAFANFMKEKKDISMFYSLSGSYFDLVKEQMASSEDFPKELADMLEEFKGTASGMFTSFENGKIVTTGKNYYPNSDVEKKAKELTAETMGELKGEQLKLVPATAFLAVSTNIKGDGISSVLGKFGLEKLIGEQDKKGVVKSILSELDGDITFALTDITKVKKGVGTEYEYETTEPLFTAYVDTKDGNKAIGIIKDLLQQEGDSLVEVAPGRYTLNEAYIAVTGNTLAVTNNQVSLDNQPVANAFSDLSKGKLMLISGDIKPLKEIATKNINDKTAAPIVDKLISLFDTYELTSTAEVIEGKVVMTDKDQNSLAAICQWLDTTLTSLNGQLPF
jgi:hypothetical protein